MNIRAIFISWLTGSAPAQSPPLDIDAQLAAYNASLTESFRDIASESERFLRQYGEFTAFLYRPDFDLFLRRQVLFFRQPSEEEKPFLYESHWPKKHAFNFPGPFYAGESDTCGTGIGEAPENVVIDGRGCEYIFRQPANYYELLCVLNAAEVETVNGYAADGNQHWTYAACQQWWRNRPQLLHDLNRPEVVAANDGQAQRYAAYLRGEAEMDLRRYCYFLEHGAYPPAARPALPEV